MFDAMSLTRDDVAAMPDGPDPDAALPVPDAARPTSFVPRVLDPDTVERWVAPPVHASIADVSAGIDAVVAIQEEIDALEAAKLLAVERMRRAAVRSVPDLLDEEDRALARAGTSRRYELARRALVADTATALRVTERDADHVVDTAQTLCHTGRATLTALRQGRLSVRHATVLADTLADLPEGQAQAEVQSAALAGAGADNLAQFRRRVRRARDRAHPAPTVVRHEAARARRAVHLDPGADGMCWLSAYLPATSAHAVGDRLDKTARDAWSHGDGRSADQLRADALVDLLLATTAAEHPGTAHTTPNITTAAEHPDGGTNTAPAGRAGANRAAPTSVTAAEHPGPDVNDPAAVGGTGVANLAALARRITPRVLVTVPVLALARRTDHPAELDGHGPVDPDTARLLTANAPSLRRILVDPVDGNVLTADAGTYGVPAALRDLLRSRDGTCRFPGCTRSAARSDLDHTLAWSDGGTTTADNLAHLCRRHHVLKHQTTWGVRRAGPDQPVGTLRWTSPTGRTHLTRAVDGLDTTGLEEQPPTDLPPPGTQDDDRLTSDDPPGSPRPVAVLHESAAPRSHDAGGPRSGTAPF